MNEDLMVKRNYRTRRVWKTTYTALILLHTYTHCKINTKKLSKSVDFDVYI